MMKWTHKQSIAYECAREVITDMMAYCSHWIAEESAKEAPDADRLAQLRADRSKLARERSSLRVTDDAEVARIRTEYGAIVRARYQAIES
jgi:hypothetical protein